MTKPILITGGSRGIGKAIALRLAQAGHNLMLTYAQAQEEADEVAEQCRTFGVDAVVLKLDMRNSESMRSLVEEVARLDGISTLVNNAGCLEATPFSDQPLEAIERLYRVNLEGPVKLTRLLLPYLDECIVNIVSVAATEIQPRILIYSSSKAGLLAFTTGLAQFYPSLRVYSVSPDETSTGMSLFKGRNPQDVAEVVARAIAGAYPSGANIDVATVLRG
jgi:3-oxoacyl-[acyl-carrier protein] reductase